MSTRIDLVQKQFGRLLVVGFAGTDKHRRAMWRCICECGAESIISGANLLNGYTKSCGCLFNELNPGITLTPNGKQTRLYMIWGGMRQRCSNPNHIGYKDYGGRGITVCDEWKSFKAFHTWAMSNGYTDGMSIDRKDNDASYCPSNCQWIPREEQGIHTHRIHFLTLNGATKSITEWSRLTGIGRATITKRINILGWPIERALTQQ
jgi:hypothetical protein